MILTAYTATQQYHTVLKDTLQSQQAFPGALQADQLVVSDGDLPGNIDIPVLIVDPWDPPRNSFNKSRCQNAALQYADDHEYDWIVLLDADAVLCNEPVVYPETGWARLKMYRTHGSPPFEVWNSSYKDRVRQKAWFLISRSLFDRRFDEHFSGYGYEAADFLNHVMRDVPQGETDLSAIHMDHDERPWHVNPPVAMRRRYRSRLLLHPGND